MLQVIGSATSSNDVDWPLDGTKNKVLAVRIKFLLCCAGTNCLPEKPEIFKAASNIPQMEMRKHW
jgi:hypothetical protein